MSEAKKYRLVKDKPNGSCQDCCFEEDSAACVAADDGLGDFKGCMGNLDSYYELIPDETTND